MKIHSVRIKNFRGFKDATVNFDSLTSLVGPNGAGKSTILSALNIFFQETSNATAVATLSREDFHKGNCAEPIEITVTFVELSKSASEDLSSYVRQGKLTVTAVASMAQGGPSAGFRSDRGGESEGACGWPVRPSSCRPRSFVTRRARARCLYVRTQIIARYPPFLWLRPCAVLRGAGKGEFRRRRRPRPVRHGSRTRGRAPRQARASCPRARRAQRR